MQKLYEYRVLRRLRQRDLAKKLGISQTLYCFIETGKRNPSIKVREKIDKLLKSDD